MKKTLSIILAVCLCVFCTSCHSEDIKETTTQLTQTDVQKILETYLEPQVEAYRTAFEVDDLRVDIQFKECSISYPQIEEEYSLYIAGSVYCTIRDVIVSPSISKKLSEGEFTDEMLKQLSAIEFEYPDAGKLEKLKYEDYNISVISALIYPIFADENGNEYTVSEGILLNGDIIAYISSDAHLEYECKVGDNIKEVVPRPIDSGSNTGSIPSGSKCPNCKGSGYVKYHYGDSDFQAFLDGYDPYSVGKCTSCKGKGYN